jgi:DNA-binding transcriptional LysR family regulator
MHATPHWGDLQMFLAAAREGTLAAAATTLGVNASTVQRRIGKLETELATRLFDRKQRGYSLTAAGEELLAHVLTIEQEILAIDRRIGGRDQGLQGTIRVATVDDLATGVLSPILRDFRRQHPKVTVEMEIGSSFSDLARRQADVAIRFGGKPALGDLIVKHVSRVDVGLYGSRSYFRTHDRPTSLPDLRHHAIVCGGDQMRGLPMERIMDRYADPTRIAYRSDSMLARACAVRDGLGIGFLARFVGEKDRMLERLDLAFPELASDLWMVVHTDLRRNARVRAFVDFAEEALAAYQPLFEASKAESASRVPR